MLKKASYNTMNGAIKDALPDGEQLHVFYSAYPTNKMGDALNNLNDTAIVGTVVLVAETDEFWGEGGNYISEPITNPTWLELAVLANKMIVTTGDYHHKFFENIVPAGRYRLEKGLKINNIPAWELVMGS